MGVSQTYGPSIMIICALILINKLVSDFYLNLANNARFSIILNQERNKNIHD